MIETEAADPFMLFDQWMAEAQASEPALADAMCLSTIGENGAPSIRMVLLKEYGPSGFVFYTNTQSRKGRALAANSHAALCLHWKSLARQISIEGRAEQVSDVEADAYFATRARDAQVGAWASKQSQRLPSRGELEERVKDFEAKYADTAIPRPLFWSGYRVVPTRIEFWQNRDSRLHDRLVYTMASAGWTKEQLYP